MTGGKFKVICNVLGVVLACLTLSFIQVQETFAQWPTGLEALEQVEDWPLQREGVLYGQISSADPMGGDADGTGYLYRQDSLYVIFDQQGPGCVYRIWVRNSAGAADRTLKFFFDNETTPRINRTVGQLFSGLVNPFLTPLVGNAEVSSGGNYLYLPLAFAQHLKIAFVGGVEAHQISYQIYPPGTEITTYTGSEDPSEVVSQWQNTGSDPKDPTGNIFESGMIGLPPGQTETFFSCTGAGSITSLRMTPDPNVLSTIESLWLRFYWDDNPSPQVECTFGSFFGCLLGPATLDGLPVGIAGSEYYCFFPMPFWDAARLEIYNASINNSVDVSYELTYKTDPYPSESGYFCTSQANFTMSVQNFDMLLAELPGHGHLAGVAVSLMSRSSQEFLHGDLLCYLDGTAHPIIQGTDFDGDFNAGNYFSTGAYSLPVHGAPIVSPGLENKVSAYRFFLGDLIPFGNSISLRAEHGHGNKISVEYAAVVYAYARPEIALILTDDLNVGDPIDEAAHDYTVSGGQIPVDHYYAYPGSYDDQYFEDSGWNHYGHSDFTVSVDPENTGVRLVRRRDASVFPQAAVVYVNGDSVGIWWDGYYNFYKRWGDSIFEIPGDVTSGLSQIDVEVSFYEGNSGWNEYYYWVFSHVPPRPDVTPPDQVTNLIIESVDSGSQMKLSWDPAGDDRGISRYRVYRSAEAGVEPTEEFLVRETPVTDFTDLLLQPGTRYYYLVSAVDYSGNEGPPSLETSQRTSSNYLYEAEFFEGFVASSGDTAYVGNMISYGDNWSGQYHLFYGSDRIGDFFTAFFEVAESDTYDISGYFTQGWNYGSVSLKIDSIPVGDAVDLYSPVIVRSPKFEFGTIYLEAGLHLFGFEITGKNAASTGYAMGVDNLLLTSHYLLPVSPGNSPESPYIFSLSQNFPNPFNSATRLHFSLPQPGFASLAIYDIMGRQLSVIAESWFSAGPHTAIWNAEDAASGIYFILLQQGPRRDVRKILLLK